MRKKAIIGLTGLALMSMATFPVSAEEKQTDIHAIVPSEYQLTIPAETNIEFGATSTNLDGVLKVTGNVLPSQKVKVTVNKTAFSNKAQGTTLPYELVNTANNQPFESADWNEDVLRDGITGKGQEIQLAVQIKDADWKNAKAGEYEGHITFIAGLQ